MNERHRAEDRRLDWGLAELQRGDAGPDLTSAVQQRRRRGDGRALLAEFAGEAARPPQPMRWLAAAGMLLGLGVVVGVLWLRREPPAVPAQDPPAAPPVTVDSRADIDALPATTRAVIGNNLDDGDVQALLRLRDLEALELRNPAAIVTGLGLKTADRSPRTITTRSFATFAQLTKLRRLQLRGTWGINAGMPMGGSGPGPEAIAAATLGELERLPLLAELALAHVDTPDYVLAALPRLRSLQRLDLSANHGFGPGGIEAIVQCRSLRALSLRYCQQLNGTDLARLGELPVLEDMDVGSLDGINWRSNLIEPPSQPRVRGSGVTDEALAGIARAPALQKLYIQGGNFTKQGLLHLGACTKLEELDMSGAGGPDAAFVDDLPKSLRVLAVGGDYTDAFCTAVAAQLPALSQLDVSACYKITDQGIGALVAMPQLRTLEMRQMYGLTRAVLPHLEKATWLRSLDVRHCDFLTKDDVDRLGAALPDCAIESNFTEPARR